MTFTGGELKVKESAVSQGYGVRVLAGKKLGFGYCQNEKGIKKALAQAEKLSRFAVESSFSFAPPARFKNPDIFDKSLQPSDFSSWYALVTEARLAAESLGGKARIIVSASKSDIRLENTAGFSGAYKRTDFSVYAETMHDTGFGFCYFSSNKKPSSLHATGLKAAEMAKSMREAKKPDAGSYTVVMEPEALESLLDILMPSFSGDWKRRGISKLEAGKKMFSEKLTIREDGLSKGTSARPFDDEGTPSKTRSLVEKGVVSSFLFDRETAALARAEESGACTRASYDAPPMIGQSNLVLSPGDRKFDDLERHIKLHHVHGSHTANMTTGDFGLEVSVAFMVDKGEKKPLRGFMLSGNVFDMFSDIEAIEKDVRVLGGLVAPRIAFRNMRVVS